MSVKYLFGTLATKLDHMRKSMGEAKIDTFIVHMSADGKWNTAAMFGGLELKRIIKACQQIEKEERAARPRG